MKKSSGAAQCSGCPTVGCQGCLQQGTCRGKPLLPPQRGAAQQPQALQDTLGTVPPQHAPGLGTATALSLPQPGRELPGAACCLRAGGASPVFSLQIGNQSQQEIPLLGSPGCILQHSEVFQEGRQGPGGALRGRGAAGMLAMGCAARQGCDPAGPTDAEDSSALQRGNRCVWSEHVQPDPGFINNE